MKRIKVRKLKLSLFLLLVICLYGCNQSPITKDSIHIKFPLFIDVNNIPNGWKIDDHYGYALQNSNIKKIYINNKIINGNFYLTVYTNEPLKTYKKEYDFKGVSMIVSPDIAADILDTLLNQNIPLYEIPRNNVVEWIDLNNKVKYFYSLKDSVFLISYLVPYTSEPHNRRNRLREK